MYLSVNSIDTLRTFMPCHRDIARNGLSARRVRNERSAVRFALPSIARLRIDTCFRKKSIIRVDYEKNFACETV